MVNRLATNLHGWIKLYGYSTQTIAFEKELPCNPGVEVFPDICWRGAPYIHWIITWSWASGGEIRKEREREREAIVAEPVPAGGVGSDIESTPTHCAHVIPFALQLIKDGKLTRVHNAAANSVKGGKLLSLLRFRFANLRSHFFYAVHCLLRNHESFFDVLRIVLPHPVKKPGSPATRRIVFPTLYLFFFFSRCVSFLLITSSISRTSYLTRWISNECHRTSIIYPGGNLVIFIVTAHNCTRRSPHWLQIE